MGNKKEDQPPYAIVKNGKIVLIDPTAHALMQAVNKHNCENTYLAQLDKINHFKNRITEKELDPQSVVINIIHVDARYGFEIAEMLMPGHDWQQYRDKGEEPFASGISLKEGIIEIIATFDKEAAEKLKQMKEIPVVVINYGVVEIFSV